ncbi:IS91 family transposase [Cytophagaceae bacterium ABcell3]|nr:IS91 family transposase [Cytophagaceae bacterium ABcell3]
MRAQHEVAHVLKKHWPKVESHPNINRWQLRTLGALMRCRTNAMGGHIYACKACGVERISYNSCRNRHCPKCQGKNREDWIRKREGELLPVPYFHVVFTLPDALNGLAMGKPKEVYDTLFEAAWETVATFASDPQHLGAKAGMVSILHTWGQTLSLHPHLHCIVPGGGLTKQGKWKAAKGKKKSGKRKAKYLFPVKAMSKVFRAKYVEKLKYKIPDLHKALANSLFEKDWVIYAKRPFGHPKAVLEYLGRYTHKIAISNHRIREVGKDTVTFGYKDYRQGAKKLEMELDAMEFIRRFSMHVLPRGFMRIRHYGILSSSSKKTSIPEILGQLEKGITKAKEVRTLETYNPKVCPCCKEEALIPIGVINKRGPPVWKKSLDYITN